MGGKGMEFWLVVELLAAYLIPPIRADGGVVSSAGAMPAEEFCLTALADTWIIRKTR